MVNGLFVPEYIGFRIIRIFLVNGMLVNENCLEVSTNVTVLLAVKNLGRRRPGPSLLRWSNVCDDLTVA